MKSIIFATILAVTLARCHAAPTAKPKPSFEETHGLGTGIGDHLGISDHDGKTVAGHPRYAGHGFHNESEERTVIGHSGHGNGGYKWRRISQHNHNYNSHFSGIYNRGSYKRGVNGTNSFNQGHIFYRHGSFDQSKNGHSDRDPGYDHSNHSHIGHVSGIHNQTDYEKGVSDVNSFNQGHIFYRHGSYDQSRNGHSSRNSGYGHGGYDHSNHSHISHISGVFNQDNYEGGVNNTNSFNQGHIFYRHGSHDQSMNGHSIRGAGSDHCNHSHIGNISGIYNRGSFNQGHIFYRHGSHDQSMNGHSIREAGSDHSNHSHIGNISGIYNRVSLNQGHIFYNRSNYVQSRHGHSGSNPRYGHGGYDHSSHSHVGHISSHLGNYIRGVHNQNSFKRGHIFCSQGQCRQSRSRRDTGYEYGGYGRSYYENVGILQQK